MVWSSINTGGVILTPQFLAVLLLTDPSDQHHTTQTSEFKPLSNGTSTILMNVFKRAYKGRTLHTGRTRCTVTPGWALTE